MIEFLAAVGSIILIDLILSGDNAPVIGGVLHKMVGAVNKHGFYYAFDRTAIHNGPLWKTQIAAGGPSPTAGQGSISSSAWNGTSLFMAGAARTINGKSCKGGLQAVHPATGACIWQRCLTVGFVMGAVTMVPGVVAIIAGPNLMLFSSVTGKTLFTTKGSGVAFYGSPSISNGVLYVGGKNKSVYAYGL